MLIPSASATIVRSVLLAGKVSVTLPGQVLTPNLQSPDRNMRPLRSLINCLRETKGVAALEFALIGPFLCIFILGVVDLGFGFQAQMAVTRQRRPEATRRCSTDSTRAQYRARSRIRRGSMGSPRRRQPPKVAAVRAVPRLRRRLAAAPARMARRPAPTSRSTPNINIRRCSPIPA